MFFEAFWLDPGEAKENMLRALAGRLELERSVISACVVSRAFWLDPGEG